MMYQGLFGVFPFTVSDSDVCTFRDFRQSRELQFAEHKTLDGLDRLQHTGRSLDPISLNVLIAPLNGVYTVELRLRALDLVSRLGKELPLVIGRKISLRGPSFKETVRFEVRELSDILASHDSDNQFARTKGYPARGRSGPITSTSASRKR